MIYWMPEYSDQLNIDMVTRDHMYMYNFEHSFFLPNNRAVPHRLITLQFYDQAHFSESENIFYIHWNGPLGKLFVKPRVFADIH